MDVDRNRSRRRESELGRVLVNPAQRPLQLRKRPKWRVAAKWRDGPKGDIAPVHPNAETEMRIGYSINSCALIRMDVGRVMPSDFATRALTISSRSVGSSIGMSPGLVPFNILSMK